jgi:hypothetical protein
MKQKSQEERLKECIELRKEINKLGLECLQEIEALFSIMNDFIRNGTSASGKINIPSISRVAEYIFSNKPHIVSTVVLKYIPPKNYYNFNLP